MYRILNIVFRASCSTAPLKKGELTNTDMSQKDFLESGLWDNTITPKPFSALESSIRSHQTEFDWELQSHMVSLEEELSV